MRPFVQCIAEITAGSRPEVVEAVRDAFAGGGVRLLEVLSDAGRDRTVLHLAGDPSAVEAASLAGAAEAATRIDVTSYEGPGRPLGAVEALTFVPLAGVSTEDCAELARRVAERVGVELDIPVYLEGEAGGGDGRMELAREGGLEDLREHIADDPARAPDFGPHLVGSAGVIAVGARAARVTLDVVLRDGRPEVAAAIAAAVDGDSGGLADVSARAAEGVDGAARLTLSIERPDRTPVSRVIELVRLEAARRGDAHQSTVLHGLVPQATLVDATRWLLRLESFAPDQVLETRLFESAPTDDGGRALPREFVTAVAADGATPGGGSVAALSGALAAALSGMVAGLTVGRDRFAAVQDDMRRLRVRASELQRELLELVDADSEAFEAVMEAYGLPRATAEETENRRESIQAALRRATEVPLDTMRRAVETLRLARSAARHGNPNAVSDAGVAAFMAHAAARSASLNVETNVMGLRDLAEGDRYRSESGQLLAEAATLVDEIDRVVRSRIAG